MATDLTKYRYKWRWWFDVLDVAIPFLHTGFENSVWTSCSPVWLRDVSLQTMNMTSKYRLYFNTMCPVLLATLTSPLSLPSSVVCNTVARRYLVVVNYKVWLQITLMAPWLQIRALWASLYCSSLELCYTEFSRGTDHTSAPPCSSSSAPWVRQQLPWCEESWGGCLKWTAADL